MPLTSTTCKEHYDGYQDRRFLANLVWNSMIDRDRRRYYSVAIPNQPTPDGWRTLGAFPTQTEAHEYARRTYPRVMNYQVVGYIGL